MSAISLKSITGITSITTPAGVDNQLTLHNNNTSEAVKLDIAGNVHINNQLAVAGVSTFSSNVTISKQNAVIELSDPDSSDANYQIRNDNGTFDIKDSTNSTVKIRAASSYVTVFPNLNANNGLDVMGTITGDGNLDIADSIRHSGDVNTKITFPANDTISFDTAGSERLRIKSDGNVGIGTDDPEGKLHIYSNNPSIKLTDFNQAADNTNWHISAGNTKILRIQALTDAGVGGGGLFDFYRNNQNIDEFRGMQGGNYWFVINNPNRRVGIGTDDPKRLLHLQSTGDALARITSADGNAAYLELGDVSDPDGGKIVYDSGSNLTFYSASSERLRITSGGDVTIGNSSVAFPSGGGLQVYNASAPRIKLTNSTTGVGSGDGLQIYMSGSTAIFDQKENAEMRFYTNASQRLTITSTGQTLLTRGSQGGRDSTGNASNFMKIGTWYGIDQTSRLKITIFGSGTYDSNADVAGETIIYISNNANNTMKGHFYSHTNNRFGVQKVAFKYDSSTSPTNCQVWIKYNGGYSPTQHKVDASEGYWVGADVDTSSTSVPSGATEASSFFAVATSDGSQSYERLRIRSDGNVQIGNSPANLAAIGAGPTLGINGAAPEITLRDTASNNPYAWIATNDAGSLTLAADQGNNANSSNINFRVDGSERVRIDSSGRLLIGATSSSSSAKLAVSGGVGNPEAFFELNRTDDPANNQNIGIIEFCQGNAASRLAARIITRRDGAIWGAASLPTRFEFHLCAQGSNSAQERLRLTVNELLPGANNTTALGNSSLKWSNVSTNYLTCGLVNSQGSVASFKGGDYNQINIAHKQNSGWGMLLTNSDSNVYNQGYHTSTSGNQTPIAMINVNNDALYLGTNNTARWRVEHDGHFIPFSNGSYDIGSTGRRVRTMYATNATNTSDRNEKNTITESDLGLDFICKLKPVSYKWNQKEGGDLDTKTHYGLISQDVEEIINETGKTLDDFGAVDKPEEGAMGLSYNEFISPLIKAIQEQQEQIKTLETKIAALDTL